NDFDRAEVSAIGFEIADFSGENPEAVIRLTPDMTDLAGIEDGVSHPLAGARIDVFPNPSANFTLRFVLPVPASTEAGRVSTGIYDIHGRLINNLTDPGAFASCFDLVWDGTDNMGRPCRAGAYFVRLEAPGFDQSSKIILSR
ncbi:T9SS type A sorting domain-containing protein, partial [Candidatus Eisenbacteria bacterium]